MLNDGPHSMGEMAKDVCKPNYEMKIRRAKETLSKNLAIQDALFNYNGYHCRGKLAELVGELYSEQKSLEYNIQEWIAEQEKAQD